MLIVDDMAVNRLILRNLFEDIYDIIEAENGREAINLINYHQSDISIVLLDIVMPIMDGFDVLAEMNRTGIIRTVPVVIITGENDEEHRIKGYGLGVSDLVTKPFNPEIIKRRVDNTVNLYRYKYNLEQELAAQRAMLEEQAEQLRLSNQYVIDALATMVEFRSMESGEHIKRIRLLTQILLSEIKDDYQLTEEDVEMIASASAMHDVGKIAIPDAVLLKPGALTKEEFDLMKTHTVRGCDILKTINYTQEPVYFKYCYEICRYHHERWNGKGYPDGLEGDEIPIWAQATSLADVYDALTSRRVYKGAYTHDEAFHMILDGECGVFNPKLINALIRVADQLEESLLSTHPEAIRG
jgi:putative two-component system response regulator